MKKMKNLLAVATLFAAAPLGKAQLTCNTQGLCATELVVNGNFTDGNTGFTSTLINNCSCGEASYCVANEPRTKCNNGNWLDDLWDNTVGNTNGSYMIIDGQDGGNNVVWSQNVFLINGHTYRFRMSVIPTVSTPSAGQFLNVTAGATNIMAIDTAAYADSLWNDFCRVFTYSGQTGIVPLAITQAGEVADSDYGLDDISLVEDETGEWHQTTKNASGFDMTKDVITDDDGNVYVTGYYTFQTTLEGSNAPDITITNNMPARTAAYVAKYSPCGNLLWEAHTLNGKNEKANSIVLDQVNNRVYIAGEAESAITFAQQTACGGGLIPVGANGYRGFVAAFDMTTGCAEVVEIIDMGTFTRCEAITINENTGSIYIGGTVSANTGFSPETSFIRKYTPNPTGTTLGAPISGISSSTTSGLSNNINDMDFDEANSRLWIIGNFRTNVTFAPGGTLNALSTNTLDAFLLSYTDAGTTYTINTLVRGNNSASMTGEGICIDASNGSVFVTGSYVNAFGFGQPGFQVPGITLNSPTAGDKSYMIKVLGGTAWGRRGYATDGQTRGKSVSARNGVAYFTGTYSRNALQMTGFSPYAFVTAGLATLNPHTYVAAYNNAGTAVFANATADPNSNSAVHAVESIYAGLNGNNFIAGNYRGNMTIDFFTASPASDLNSTGAAGASNGFLVRVNSNFSGAFRNEGIEEETAVADLHSQLTVFPNPTNGQSTIAINGFDASNKNCKMILFNALGEQLKEIAVTGEKMTLDLSVYESGIYLLSFSDGNSTSITRISKTN